MWHQWGTPTCWRQPQKTWCVNQCLWAYLALNKGKNQAVHYMLNEHNMRFSGKICMSQNEQIRDSSRSLKSGRAADLLHVAMALTWPRCPSVNAWIIAGYGPKLPVAWRQLVENKASMRRTVVSRCRNFVKTRRRADGLRVQVATARRLNAWTGRSPRKAHGETMVIFPIHL